MKLILTVYDNELAEEVIGDMKIEGVGDNVHLLKLIMVAADYLQAEWVQLGLQEHWPFREMLTDVRRARK